MAQHTAGRLKQQNKKHKAPGGTRPSRENAVSGRTAGKEARSTTKQRTTNNQTCNKQDRLNRQKQLIQEKRLTTIRNKRQVASSNVQIIVVVPLSTQVNLAEFPKILAHDNHNNDWQLSSSQQNRITYYHKQQKCQFQFFLTEGEFGSMENIEGFLQLISVADSVLLVTAFQEDLVQPLIDETGKKYLDLLAAYGSPTATVGFLSPLSSSKVNFKISSKPWKYEFDYLQQVLTVFQQNIKFIDLKDSTLCRVLGAASTSTTGKVPRWKSQRSYFVTDSVSFLPSNRSEGGKCRVIVNGCLRGVPLFAHSLIQICGVGVGTVVSIAKVNDNNVTDGMEGDITVGSKIIADPNQQDSIESEAVGDDLVGEQTWPTDEELRTDMMTAEEDDKSNEIDHTDDEAELEGDKNDDDDENVDTLFNRETIAGRVKPPLNAHVVRYSDGVAVDGVEDDGDDFVEVPGDMSARQRFARYRALQSFRSSYWHPQENLPAAYRRIFQLEDVKGMQRRLLHDIENRIQVQMDSLIPRCRIKGDKSSASVARSRANSLMECEDVDQSNFEGENSFQSDDSFCVHGLEDVVRSDQYITMELDDVPSSAVDYFAKKGYFILFALYPHENKLSVAHYSIRSTANIVDASEENNDNPTKHTGIKSKTPLLFHNGFRSFWTKPIFSENNLNCDKHKFLRYLPNGEFCVSTCIGPVTLVPAPLLVFRVSPYTGKLELIATGNQLSVAPERIILKRIILWGTPVRVNKKTAVVKHMFYDPTDVKYFKPAELVTDRGMRGHILESVGTHGLFKVHFNAPITQQDSVQLVLYKRVYPKFPDDDRVTVI